MVFSSFAFLFWFLPFCLIVYMLARKSTKNLVLLFFNGVLDFRLEGSAVFIERLLGEEYLVLDVPETQVRQNSGG